MAKLSLLAFLVLFNAEGVALDIEDITTNDQWAMASGSHDGLPLLIRFRNKLEPSADYSSLPQLVQIHWEFAADPTGMPTESDSGQMEEFENRLVEALEPGLNGVLTSVITTNGYREWVWYVASIDAFSEGLHFMPQEEDPYPIEIQTEPDPSWAYFFDSVRPSN